MSFGESVRSVYGKYATFDGRATRSEYWWFTLFYFLVVLAAYFAAAMLAAATRSTSILSLMLVAVVLFALLTFIPGLALLVRRLHDTGKSGWWMFVVFVPYIGGLVLFVFTLLPSDSSFNNFGAPSGEDTDHLRVNYFGPSRSEALNKFAFDAQQAAASGYQPVAQNWQLYTGGEVLEVVYRHEPGSGQWPPPPVSGQGSGSSSPPSGPPTWS
jgi:uncharacterized membrane protein YhaH (DUF805 family)